MIFTFVFVYFSDNIKRIAAREKTRSNPLYVKSENYSGCILKYITVV